MSYRSLWILASEHLGMSDESHGAEAIGQVKGGVQPGLGRSGEQLETGEVERLRLAGLGRR